MGQTEVTTAREDTPMVVVTEDGFVIGHSVLNFAGTQDGRLKDYDANGSLLDIETRAYIWGADTIQPDDALWSGTPSKKKVVKKCVSVSHDDSVFDFGKHEVKINGFNGVNGHKDDIEIV